MKTFITKIALLTLSLMFFSTPTVLALHCNAPNLSAGDAIQCGANGASGNNQDASKAANNIDSTVASIINIMSAAVGIISVIMIIMAGVKFVTSSGNQERVAGARRTIVYAVIGLVVVALAQIIVRFVLDKTTNSTDATSSSTGSSGFQATTGPNGVETVS